MFEKKVGRLIWKMLLHTNLENFRLLIIDAGNYWGLEDEYIEKDYYASLFLKKLQEIEPNIVFKGGTSLSKCYGLINRFSEDIDISRR